MVGLCRRDRHGPVTELQSTDPAELLRAEAAAISAAAHRLDRRSFEDAVDLLVGCRGKIILVGAGTSGVIARKLVATLTSTGCPATFLHPNDALHGGLGAVQAGDVVVMISNSGETSELLGLLPYLRHRELPIVSILGRLDSSLAHASSVVLDAGADQEICPYNLAPTCSTTVALALGDALAVTVYHRRGLTPEQFALNHPSGALGRRLTLRVEDVMNEACAPVASDAEWLDVVDAISEGGVGAVAVVDGGVLTGIVTDGDVRRAVGTSDVDRLRSLTARELMTSDPVTVRLDVLAVEALHMMEDRKSQISVLPVVDALQKYLGMVRLHDLVRGGV